MVAILEVAMETNLGFLEGLLVPGRLALLSLMPTSLHNMCETTSTMHHAAQPQHIYKDAEAERIYSFNFQVILIL